MHERMFRFAMVYFAVAGFVTSVSAQQISLAARSELAPTGRLRVGINFGNALLAAREGNGTPRGIAVDLAQELARRAGLPIDIIGYDSAGRMADGVKSGSWDIAFLGSDPDRAGEIAFTAPYLEIDTTYLVPAGSPLKMLADVDREGVRIAVSAKSAYDLYLTRSLKHATLVRAPSVDASVDLFFSDKLDALAGLRPLLVEVSAIRRGTRVLDGRFAVVQQAAGVPKQRTLAATYVFGFIEDVKTSGFVTQIIEKNKIRDVSVAAPATIR